MRFGIVGFILKFTVQAGCLALVLLSCWYLFGNAIKSLFMEHYNYSRLEKTVKAKKQESSNSLVEHINRLIKATSSKETRSPRSQIFLAATLIIFIFSFLVSMKTFPLAYSLVIAVICALFPYSILKLKLRTIRIDSSYDADILVISITNEYKQHYFNMIQAIENCAVQANMGSYSRRNLYQLSLTLKSYHAEEDLDRALDQFVYSYDTEWCRLLRLNIKMAIHRGINVSSGMEDTLKKLKDSREQIEVSKRYNSDTFSMIRFLLVPLYIGTLYMAVQTFGFTIKKFLEYQFLNVVGLRLGILTFLSIIISFIALKMIRKPKYDI